MSRLQLLERFSPSLVAALLLVVIWSATPAQAQCTLNSTNPSVTICSPANGATVTSPVQVIAGTTDSSTVTLMQVYVDGVKVYEVHGNTLSTSLSVATGTHRLTVQAYDSSNRVFNTPINITVSNGGPPPPPPPPPPGCTLNTMNQTVTICAPANGATVASPVQITAGTTDSSTVTLMQVYEDGKKVFEASGSTLSTSLTMSYGTHRVTVQAYDSAKHVFNSTINIDVSSSGGGGGGGGGGQGLDNIKHIIFMVQENRSADSYLGVFNQYRASHGINDNAFDGMDLNKAMPSRTGAFNVTPYHYKTVCTDNLTPAWNESHYDIHNGAMDFFMKTTGSVPSTIDPEGTRAVGYYDWTDLPYYYDLAFKFSTSDRYFSPVLATTIPNRMYLFTATSFGYIRPAEPPAGTKWPQPTIFDRLLAAGVSWRYYYQDNSTYLAQFATWDKGGSGHVYNISQYYTDVASDNLPSVIFIERGGQIGTDEHPLNNIQKGAATVKKIIDALMAGPNWSSSVFILTFDEGGGLYDHVDPPAAPLPDNIAPIYKAGDNPATFNQYGFRVPLIVVSPWSKPNLVSHVVRDHTSILKLIEKRFELQSLTNRDANADDMEEFFDFSAPHYPTPPNLDDQPQTGICNKNLQNAPGH